jgi:subtilisin family serine protease
MNTRPTAAGLRAFVAAAAALALCPIAAARPQALPPVQHGAADAEPFVLAGARFADSHLIVQLASGVRVAADRKGGSFLRSAGRAALARESGRALREAGVASIESIFVEPPRDAATARALGLDRWHRVELAAGTDPAAAIARLVALRGAFSAVELDPEGGVAEIPNDVDFGMQWNLRNIGQVVGGMAGTPGSDIDIVSVWDVERGSADLVIALLDSGLDAHRELLGRILPGINIPDGNNSTGDECNHGTHVGGMISAAGNDTIGIAGMTWNTKLLPVVVTNGCTGFESNVASGLVWAVDQDARLVNMSLQFYAGSAVFQQAVQYAHAQGALQFAAAGNNGNSNIAAPARWNQTIAVAATDNRDIRATFSNFGAEIDVSAPGVNVWGCNIGSGYVYKSGTSMAVPHVTGLAALLWSHRPSLTRDEVRALIEQGVDDLGVTGRDDLYGLGRINAARSFELLVPPPPAEDLNGDGVVNAVDLAILTSAWGPCVDCDGGCVADLDGDCFVGASDLARLLAAW